MRQRFLCAVVSSACLCGCATDTLRLQVIGPATLQPRAGVPVHVCASDHLQDDFYCPILAAVFDHDYTRERATDYDGIAVFDVPHKKWLEVTGSIDRPHLLIRGDSKEPSISDSCAPWVLFDRETAFWQGGTLCVLAKPVNTLPEPADGKGSP